MATKQPAPFASVFWVPPGHIAASLPAMPDDPAFRAFRLGLAMESDEAVRLAAMHGLPIPHGYKPTTKPNQK